MNQEYQTIYRVNDITEADYGCEECPPDGPHAYVYFRAEEKDAEAVKTEAPEKTEEREAETDAVEVRLELSEQYLAKTGIDIGKRVVISADGKPLKYVRVVAAVIRKKDKIFATARGYGEFQGGWEFPGGKIEPGETPKEALIREIREELDTEIAVGDRIAVVEYDYPTFHLSMDCFWCRIVSGRLELLEAQEARWLTKDTLDSVEWLPADRGLIAQIREELQTQTEAVRD